MKEIRKEKIHLIFDTNILRSEPFYSRAEYSSLETLVEFGHVEVYIPELVEREYTEQLKDDFSKYIGKIKSNSKSLSRSASVAVSDKNLEKLNTVINKIERDGFENIEQGFTNKFYDGLFASRLTIQSHHTPNVFDSYFAGTDAFKTKKERKDIPDAFIFEIIKDLNRKQKNLVVLVADKQLNAACQSIEAMTYGSLKEFLDSEDIQELLKDNSEKDFIDFITAGDGTNSIYSNFRPIDLVDELSGKEIVDILIPSDGNDATIASVGDYKDLTINTFEFTYLDKNKLSIPFRCEVEVYLQYFVFKADYYANDLYGSASDWNKHYFLVESEEYVSVEGDLVVDFSMIDFSDAELDFEFVAEDIELKINAIKNINLIKEIVQKKTNPVQLTCNECKSITNIDSCSLDWELTESVERKMGIENCYSADIQNDCSCGNPMKARFYTWEYPEGVVSTTDSEVVGCTVNKIPVFQLNFF